MDYRAKLDEILNYYADIKYCKFIDNIRSRGQVDFEFTNKEEAYNFINKET